MPSKGPAPAPEPVRRLRRLPDLPPTLTAAAVPVEPPAGMTPAARAVWDRLAPDLIDKGVLDSWSRDPFARYCWSQAKADELQAVIDRDGAVVPGARNHEPVRHPAWTPLRTCLDELAKLESRFGLTPADRSRVNVTQSSDPAARYLDPSRLLS